MYNRNCYLRLLIYLTTAIRKNKSTSLPLCKNKLNLLKGEQIRHENEKKKKNPIFVDVTFDKF